MRHSALTATVVALTVCTSFVQADDDFAMLLKDLTFADAAVRPPAAVRSEPAVSPQPLAVASEQTTDDLRPVPSGLRMPVMLESASMSLQGIPAIPESVNPSQVTLSRPVANAESSVQLLANQATGPEQAAVPLQDPVFPAPVVASQLAGHRHHSVADECHTAAVQTIPCRPRTRPNLPTSTLRQYFRSDACYTHVWDGYHRNCKHHDHLHGTCDCFRDQFPCGETLPCDRDGCASCDAGCDR